MQTLAIILLIFLFVAMISLAISVLVLFRLFQKAEIPGWYAFVPFLNVWHFMKMIRVPFYFVFLAMIPLANFIIYFYLLLALAKAFGKEKQAGVLVGLMILPFVFVPWLAFGSARYVYLEESRAWSGDLLDDDL